MEGLRNDGRHGSRTFSMPTGSTMARTTPGGSWTNTIMNGVWPPGGPRRSPGAGLGGRESQTEIRFSKGLHLIRSQPVPAETIRAATSMPRAS